MPAQLWKVIWIAFVYYKTGEVGYVLQISHYVHYSCIQMMTYRCSALVDLGQFLSMLQLVQCMRAGHIVLIISIAYTFV